MSAPRKSSAFVPHDLAAPVRGLSAGPLAGLTVAVKDMYDIAGERTGGGSPDWLAAQSPATRHAGVVERLLAAGADIIGKTVCDEFFFSLTGVNAHYGAPVNIRAPGRIPGGSSAGSAAAVAAGACDLALGSDTGGSMRVPAALCGIYGLRPTHERVDMAGAMPMAPAFDVAGWFAASPGVMRKAGPLLLEDYQANGTSVARCVVLKDAFDQADPSVATASRAFIDRAAPAFGRPEDVAIAPDGFDAWRNCFRAIQGREIWSIYGAWLKEHNPALGPGIKERMAYAAAVTADQAEAARKAMAQARAQIRSVIPPGTIAALPSAPSIAPRLDSAADALDSFRMRGLTLTCIAGLGGLPQISIPIGTVEGCPIGLSLIGWAGADEVLLDMAVELAPYCGAAY